MAVTATSMVSCSSDDVLGSDTDKTTGKNIVVKASMDEGTRATVATGSSITGFKLFGYQGSTSIINSGETPGLVFSGDASKPSDPWIGANNIVPQWPTDESTTSNFYAISCQGKSDLLAVDLTDIKDGKFKYINNTTVSLQKDLMVAADVNRTSGDEGKGNTVNLGFIHALSNVQINLRFNAQEYDVTKNAFKSTGNIDPGYKYAIKYVRIHGINAQGTYNFKDNTWTSSEPQDITISMENGYVVTALDKDSKDEEEKSIMNPGNPVAYIPLAVDGNSIMIIPQKAVNSNVSKSGTPVDDQATGRTYIELYGMLWNPSTSDDPDGSPWDYTDEDNLGGFTSVIADLDNNLEDHGFMPIYFSLPDNFEFKPNRQYTFNLNLYKAVDSTGALVLRASTVAD